MLAVTLEGALGVALIVMAALLVYVLIATAAILGLAYIVQRRAIRGAARQLAQDEGDGGGGRATAAERSRRRSPIFSQFPPV